MVSLSPLAPFTPAVLGSGSDPAPVQDAALPAGADPDPLAPMAPIATVASSGGGFTSIGINTAPGAYALNVLGETLMTTTDAGHVPLRLVGAGANPVLDLSDPAINEVQIYFHVGSAGASAAITAYANDSVGIASPGSSSDVLTVSGVTGVTVIGGKFVIQGIPTSATGLPSGSVWSNAGVLNIVP